MQELKEVAMVAAIISDVYFDKLYNDPNQREGYVNCLDIISDLSLKWWELHEHTDWEKIQFDEDYAKGKGFQGTDCWDSLVMEFAGAELVKMGYSTVLQDNQVKQSYNLLRRIAQEVGNQEGGHKLDDFTYFELNKFVQSGKVKAKSVPAPEPIKVHVRGGVAYCDDSRVSIIDHDENE